MKPRAIVVAVAFFAACAHRCPNGDTPCWAREFDFTLPDSGLPAYNIVDGEPTRVAQSNERLRAALCNNAWKDEVQGSHCRDRIADFCTRSCGSNDAGFEECLSGNGRVEVNRVCWHAAYPAFRALAPSCDFLTLRDAGQGDLYKP
jgi:hypothetical protein